MGSAKSVLDTIIAMRPGDSIQLIWEYPNYRLTKTIQIAPKKK